MTSKKKVVFRLAKLALLIAFLAYSGFFSQLAISNKEEKYTTETKNELKALEKKMDQMTYENTSKEEMEKIANQYREKLDPAPDAYKAFRAWIKAQGISGIIRQLIRLYLYLLPWFAVLFLIWFFEERGMNKKGINKKLFTNPLSLIISILIYPFIGAYILDKWLGSLERARYGPDAVLKAKQKCFAIASDDVIKRIKRLARDGLSEIFKETRNTQPTSGRIYIHLICRYLKGFVREIEHIPDSLIGNRVINRNFQLNNKDNERIICFAHC